MATATLHDAVLDALAQVTDPEMPPVSIADLGMVVAVAVDDGRVAVDLLPTFSGCPAIPMIETDVRAALAALDGVEAVTVRWRRDLVWDPEMITPAGREALAAAGIAPPGSGQQLLAVGGVRCPWCGSRNTRADSPFGAAPCRSTHTCRDCKTPFDAIKP